MAWALNIFLPGTGLIIRRREWLGFAISLLFAIGGNVALAGLLIAPATIPYWLTLLAIGLCILTWVLSQVMFIRQRRLLERQAHAVAALLQEARSYVSAGQLEDACLAVENGVAIDNENIELHLLRAGLCKRTRDERGHAESLKRLRKLDSRRNFRSEVENILDP